MIERYLFRGKREANGEWITGSLMQFNSILPSSRFAIWQKDEATHFGVDESTIEQCTGIRDKNGTLIYEGDILQHINNQQHRGVVEWVGNGYMAKAFSNDDFTEFQKSGALADVRKYWYYMHSGCFEYTEIIGNVHDEPDLLDYVTKISQGSDDN